VVRERGQRRRGGGSRQCVGEEGPDDDRGASKLDLKHRLQKRACGAARARNDVAHQRSCVNRQKDTETETDADAVQATLRSARGVEGEQQTVVVGSRGVERFCAQQLHTLVHADLFRE